MFRMCSPDKTAGNQTVTNCSLLRVQYPRGRRAYRGDSRQGTKCGSYWEASVALFRTSCGGRLVRSNMNLFVDRALGILYMLCVLVGVSMWFRDGHNVPTPRRPQLSDGAGHVKF